MLKILTIPHPILRKKAKKVDSVNDRIRKLMDDMLATIHNTDIGIGLAANQVGSLDRVIVVDLDEVPTRYRDSESEEELNFRDVEFPLFMANPEIIKFSAETSDLDEGCLSVPGQRVTVTRPTNIDVEYLDYDNNPCKLSAQGFLATVIQHEVDHLDGKLLIDYLSKLKRDTLMRKLKKQTSIENNE